ncbi:MAG: S46 family peptidase [Chitinophagaceae bacterium]|nr:S46 family peptidase [Chitinophagaceae bacterium]
MKLLKKLPLLLFLFIQSFAYANEGMWLPLLLERLNEKEMKSLGMKISAKDIYNVNSGSLKDAIVSFGGFCTGEVISTQGLVLTNHHCGFDAIQNHSTLDNNYIRDGFWAKANGSELPNPGLFVTFIVRIEDVSAAALKGVTAGLSESERQSMIDKNLEAVKMNAKKEAHQDVMVRGFFEGNQYYLFITETYRDIRLVGAPPSSIGNYGKDTDNWMWPRHTGDFSIFRIYAGKDNKPADFSPENVPFKPKKALSISLDGVAKGDFTMVFGFPGRTNEYLYSEAVRQVVEVNDPIKIDIRTRALAVIDGYMRKNEQIKIQYAAKYAGISNSWKKWQGEVLGLTKTNGVGKKLAYEKEFQQRVNANPALKAKYGNLLAEIDAAYKEIEPLGKARDYYNEIIPRIELFLACSQVNRLNTARESNGEAGIKKTLPGVQERLEGIYNEYNAEVDKNLFISLLEIYVKKQENEVISPYLLKILAENDQNLTKLADLVYSSTSLDDPAKTMAALTANPAELAQNHQKDLANALFIDINNTYYNKVTKKLNAVQDRINTLQRTYMAAQMEVFKEKRFYPDANSTLRVTYGNVKGYQARDAVEYDFYTYLDGVMEKYKPGDYEFDLPERLIDLYKKKDFGQYGTKGRQPICFIAANHTTGGNSGSPALDAYGNLVGLNFDRVWEGTMSDINYDPSICRNIMVDIRYVLFIIDKFAGAGHLVKEMKLVHPKGGR